MRYLALTTVFVLTAICSNVTKFINDKDTINLVKADNNFIPFFTKGNAPIKINIKECGSPFRLIIPNYPSIVYYESEIPKPVDKEIQNPVVEEPIVKDNTLDKITWWLIGAIFLIIVLYLILIYRFVLPLFKKKQRQPIKQECQNEQPVINNNSPQTQNTSELLSQIQQMENRIINKIESLASNKEASQKIENLQKEIESFKEKISSLDKEIEQRNQRINELNSELTQVLKKKQELESEYQKYSDKVIFVDYLESHAKAFYDYYIFCQSGYSKAIEYFQKLNHLDSELVSIVAQLLVKFYVNIPNKTNYWLGVINEIKDSKTTANNELIRSLKQLPNNEEKGKEFTRILLKEVFEKYSSSIFILTEEFSNLSKFTNENTSVVKDFEQFFTSFKSKLHSKLKTIGLDLNYVPLFEHYGKYAAHTKLVNQECSLPYKNIKSITKDTVLEIINYGFGNEVTNVILA